MTDRDEAVKILGTVDSSQLVTLEEWNLPRNIIFYANDIDRPILTLHSDGRIEVHGNESDLTDRAKQFFECLRRVAPSYCCPDPDAHKVKP